MLSLICSIFFWNYIYFSLHLRESLSYIQTWPKRWGIKVNGTKSVGVTFTRDVPTMRVPKLKGDA